MEYKDEDHPSFWERRSKLNPHYVEAADNVCVAMSEGAVFTIDLSGFFPFFSFCFWAVNVLFGAYTVLFSTEPTP